MKDGEPLKLLDSRCNVYLDFDSKTLLLIEAASGAHQSDEFWKVESIMFARIVEFIPKPEKKEEFVKKVRDEVLPILKTQKGFLEILPFFPENKAEKVITITL